VSYLPKLKFQVKEFEKWNLLHFEIENPITPNEIHTISPPKLHGTKGVILSGRGPIWLYCYLAHYYHPTKFIATYDPREGGAVVVESHTPEFKIGDIIKIKE
jgi:CRISPR-associated protein Csx3